MAIRTNVECVNEAEELVGSAIVANKQVAHRLTVLIAKLKRDNSLSISDLPIMTSALEWAGATDEILQTHYERREMQWRRPKGQHVKER